MAASVTSQMIEQLHVCSDISPSTLCEHKRELVTYRSILAKLHNVHVVLMAEGAHTGKQLL